MAETLRLLTMMRDMPAQPSPVDLSTVKSESVEGRVIVVIGANIGLGFEAAKTFAKMKPKRLVLGCRSEEKGLKAVEDIKQATGFQDVELRLVDLADFASISLFVDGIEQDIGHVDLLILNAGVNTGRYDTTKDGWELMLHTNNLGPELLALLLLPTMFKAGKASTLKPRMVVVSSGAHNWTSLDEELINHPDPLKRMSEVDYCTPAIIDRRYSDVKLFNLFFTRKLQKQLVKSNSAVIVSALNPGFCSTNFTQHMPEEQSQLLSEIAEKKAYTTEEGSRFLIQAALLHAGIDEEEEKLKGAYINMGTVQELSEFIGSAEGQQFEERLWANTIDELSKVDKRVGEIVATYLA